MKKKCLGKIGLIENLLKKQSASNARDLNRKHKSSDYSLQYLKDNLEDYKELKEMSMNAEFAMSGRKFAYQPCEKRIRKR